MSELLRSFNIVSTADPDEAQAILSRELSNLRIESVANRGRFRFEMNAIHLGRTTIAFNQFSTRTVVDAGVIENAVILSINLGPRAIVQLDDQSVGPEELCIVSPFKRTKIFREPGSQVLFVRAGLEAVEERFRELTGERPPGPLKFECSVALDHGVGAQLRQMLKFLVNDAKDADSILANPVLCAGLDDLLLSSILAVPHNYSDQLVAKQRCLVDLQVVKRAEEFLESYAGDPITISDVVAVCGCSRSALFEAFHRHRSYTPMMFLNEVRLKSARDLLLRPSRGDTVTSIAMKCGFTHVGRFAEAYRERFGEKPSETLKR